ncbi:MAG: hypothetical protein EA384_10080 [Spirochaetaceae bacterium]|nr:MAG: hypothetical protein EA384_10080 [Spirochaetaceae bacterium]
MKAVKVLIALIALIVAGALLSCAGLPPPRGDSNALIVGYLAEDYPDGYFNLPPRTISQGITLRFLNVSQNRRFTLKTRRGYFFFQSNGTDQYVLERYETEVQAPDGSKMRTGADLNRSFRAVPDSVVYLGHLTIVREKPRQAAVAGAPRTLYWTFDSRFDFQWAEEKAREFIRSRDADSEWLRYPMLRAER